MNEKGIRKTISALTALFITMSVLPACQKTPDKPIVVNKGDNKLIEKIEGSNSEALAPSGSAALAAMQTANAVAALGAPAHVLDSFTGVDGKLVVNVDADISLPVAAAVPVVKVAPDKFTQVQVDAMIAEFMQGKPMYSSYTASKSELQDKLVRTKQRLTTETEEQNRANLEQSIKLLEREIKTAPAESKWTPATGKFEKVIGTNGNQFGERMSARADLGKAELASISVWNREDDGRGSEAKFSNMIGSFNFSIPLNGQPRGVEMRVEEALALAEKTLKDLGSDLKLAQTVAVNIDAVSDDATGKEADQNTLSQAYLFTFTRNIGDVPTPLVGPDCDELTSMEDNYTKPWRYEKITVAVDDTGIIYFKWLSPMMVLGTMTDNVQLLSWNDIYGVFKKMIVTSNAWTVNKDSGNSKCTITITGIMLGMTRISSKDNPDEYMMVPVWDFAGSDVIKRPGADSSPNEGIDFLTINAVDGSIIDRGFGY